MRTALVFGASGQIGTPLLARLLAARWRVIAVSRAARVDTADVSWRRGDLAQVDALPDSCEVILSCGPLDHFARWYAASSLACARVIAFGSTSVLVKQASGEAAERDLAARLRTGEAGVLAAAQARAAHATILRPTLVYGSGADRSLTRIAAIARRWGRFALPRDATGLRQPVHVDDLADAAVAAIDCAAAHGASYALPGGETLAYHAMVARVLATLSPPPALHALPAPAFRALLSLAHAAGIASDFNAAGLRRMREDLVFDAAPARQAFGYAPRAFAVSAGMFDRA
ncbi:MAG: NAD-dependent epimerase/dehydratase family protein [Luteimonas sp.]